MPSVPVLINPRQIPAHVQILAGVDANMQKLIENDEKKKAKEKTSADEAESSAPAKGKRILENAPKVSAGSAKKKKT